MWFPEHKPKKQRWIEHLAHRMSVYGKAIEPTFSVDLLGLVSASWVIVFGLRYKVSCDSWMRVTVTSVWQSLLGSEVSIRNGQRQNLSLPHRHVHHPIAILEVKWDKRGKRQTPPLQSPRAQGISFTKNAHTQKTATDLTPNVKCK